MTRIEEIKAHVAKYPAPLAETITAYWDGKIDRYQFASLMGRLAGTNARAGILGRQLVNSIIEIKERD